MIKLTEAEKQKIKELGSEYYTVEHVQEWINSKDTVFENAPGALMAVEAKGYYDAIKRMVDKEAGNV